MLEAVNERKAVEAMQAIAVCDRSASAPFLIADGEREIRIAVEERYAKAVRRVHEPRIGIRQRIEVLPVAALETEAEVLALAEKVAGRELRLHEEAGALGVAAAELHVVLPFFAALHSHIDRLLLLVHFEVRVVVDLEVAELAELVDRLLERLHVHDLSLFEEDLAAQDFVFRGRVALELQPAEAELLAFEDGDVHVDDIVLAFDILGIDVRVDVAAHAVQLIERVEPVLDRLAADDVALLDREVARERFRLEDARAGDGDVAEAMDRPFLDRDGDPDARLLRGTDRRQLRLAECDVRVAVVLIVILDVLEILIQLRRDVEILLANPGDDVVLLHFLHLLFQTAGREVLVAGEDDAR